MPQDLSCCGPVWPPTLADLVKTRLVGDLGEPKRFGSCHLECPVSDGPDVRASEARHEEDIRSPWSDSRCVGEDGPDVGVAQRSQRIDRQPAVEHPGGQLACVPGLLPAEPDGPQLVVGEIEEVGRLDPRDGRIEAIEGGTGRVERDLLFEDQQDERLKRSRSRELPRAPVEGDDPSEIPVTLREVVDGGIEPVVCIHAPESGMVHR